MSKYIFSKKMDALVAEALEETSLTSEFSEKIKNAMVKAFDNLSEEKKTLYANWCAFQDLLEKQKKIKTEIKTERRKNG